MIRPTPTNDAGRVLGHLALLRDEGATPIEIGRALWPYRPAPRARVLPSDPWARALYEAARDAWPHLEAGHAEEQAARVAELCQRLARQRLVAPRAGLRLAGWVLRALPRHEVAAQRWVADPTRSGPAPDALDLLACAALRLDAWEGAWTAPEPQALARVLREVRECPTLAVRARSGSWRATLARAVGLHLLDAPSARVVTDEGRSVVAAWGVQ